MSGEPKVTIEGKVRVRDNKRWKPRYCIVTKASPVANSLQVHLHKEQKGGSNGSQPANAGQDGKRTLSKSGRSTVALDNFLGVQSGFPLDKESFTLAIFCQDSCVVLALDNRETLALWEARLRLSMPEVCHFDAQLVKVPPCGKVQLGPCRLHIQDHQFSVTTLAAQGPQVVHSWKIQELRRFGKLDENLYGFEGGSRSGKGEGAHVLMLDDVSGLEGTFQVAAQGLLNRQKKSVYNALMADLVGLRERMTSVHSLNSASSTTLAASVASSVYGGGSTLRRQIGACHCHCGGGSPNVANSRIDPTAPGGPSGPGSVSSASASEYDRSGGPASVAASLPGTASTPPVGSSSGGSASLQLQHGRQPSTASQDTTDSLSTLESQASTAKLCDRSSLCSESSGTGSCSGSVGVRSDESCDYDVPKQVAGAPADTSPAAAAGPAAVRSVSPSSCYDQPKNLASVASALKCPCQPYAPGGAGTCSGEHPDSFLNYDVPAQFVGANASCSNYDTPKAVVDALWGLGSRGSCHPGPMMEYETIKAITQGSAAPAGATGPIHTNSGFTSLLQGQGSLRQGFNAGGIAPIRDRVPQDGSTSPWRAGVTDAKTRLLFSQRQEQPSGRMCVRPDQQQGVTEAFTHRDDSEASSCTSNRYSLASTGQARPSQPLDISQFSGLGLEPNGIDSTGGQPHFSPLPVATPSSNQHLQAMALSTATQLLPNRRLLADTVSAGAISGAGLATCGDPAIDYVNAQLMESLHLQYPLLDDGHLQNGAATSAQALQGSSVPPAPSLV